MFVLQKQVFFFDFLLFVYLVVFLVGNGYIEVLVVIVEDVFVFLLLEDLVIEFILLLEFVLVLFGVNLFVDLLVFLVIEVFFGYVVFDSIVDLSQDFGFFVGIFGFVFM